MLNSRYHTLVKESLLLYLTVLNLKEAGETTIPIDKTATTCNKEDIKSLLVALEIMSKVDMNTIMGMYGMKTTLSDNKDAK